MKRLWLVRLGRHGEQEAHALDKGELVLGFDVGDLGAAKVKWPREAGPFLAAVKLESRLLIALYHAARCSVC